MEKRKTEWSRGRCVGRGSFGEVSLALDKSNGQIFAVKSVDLRSTVPFSLQSLENEIQILRSLSSPYIVTYLGDDLTSGTHRNLHMEYVPGGTLADAAARHHLDEPTLRSHTRCLLRALEHSHSRGVVHCDVKGRNILLGPAGLKLADFGAARRIPEASLMNLGTPLWMAPEVARCEVPSPASDIWSLGCTLIEMATGSPPRWDNVVARSQSETLFRIGFLDGLPKFPAQLSELGRDFLEKCLRREASDRWSCKQLLHHPFVADTAATEQSPRSIFDGLYSEFADDNNDDEEEDVDKAINFSLKSSFSDKKAVSSIKERINKLISKKEIGWGREEGWEVVRDGGDEEMILRSEDSNKKISSTSIRGGEEGECNEYVSFAGGCSCVVSCSVSSSCCNKAGSACQHGFSESHFCRWPYIFIHSLPFTSFHCL